MLVPLAPSAARIAAAGAPAAARAPVGLAPATRLRYAPLMRIILSNCPPDKADEIATRLVEERCAACVNALPGVRSTYRWQERIERDPETTLLIKTSAAALPRCVARLRELHPYQVPEIVVLTPDVAASFAPYVEWVRSETR